MQLLTLLLCVATLVTSLDVAVPSQYHGALLDAGLWSISRSSNSTRTSAWLHVHLAPSDTYKLASIPYRSIETAATITTRASHKDPWLSHVELEAKLRGLAAQYPKQCTLREIGKSHAGRSLLVLHLVDNANNRNVVDMRPHVRFAANIHGDEVVGRHLLLRLAQYLLGSKNGRAILRTTHVHLFPSINPDGYELRRRSNAHYVDLNRDFPDRIFAHGNNGQRYQPETQAVMQWARELKSSAIAATLHGGALVANYPWDGNAARRSGVYTACPDDALFRELASVYANAHRNMHLSRQFPGGITNGARWYVLYGGLQDWSYEHTNALELTLEVSRVKRPIHANGGARYWDANRRALLALIRRVHTGICGVVRDAAGKPAKGVAIELLHGSSGKPMYSDTAGRYWRVLLPGKTYRVKASDGSRSAHHDVVIQANQAEMQRLDFVLQ